LQRGDFEAFLKERVATIRLLQAVRGDALALRTHCPDLCLRGLEPFSCNTLNLEMQCQRQLHLRVVLNEQTLQKSAKCDPERIRLLAQERSEWARMRAQQLASLDEMEVSSLENQIALAAMTRRRSLASAQLGLEKLAIGQQPQRRATLSHTATTFNQVGLASRRLPVDLAILKEWNAKFLADIRAKAQHRRSTTAAPTAIPNPGGSTITSLSDRTAESRRALQRGSLVFQRSLLPDPIVTNSLNTAPSSGGVQGCGEQLINANSLSNNKYSTGVADAPTFRFDLRRDSLSLVGLRREALMASRPTSTESGKIASAFCDETKTAATSSSELSGLSILSEACFRFPVRRDSLSNV
jgi:hypothetical protein